METVTVNAEALRELLLAIDGPDDALGALRRARDQVGVSSTIGQLTLQYNQALEESLHGPVQKRARVFEYLSDDPPRLGRRTLQLELVEGAGCRMRRPLHGGRLVEFIELSPAQSVSLARQLGDIVALPLRSQAEVTVAGLTAIRTGLSEPFQSLVDFHFGESDRSEVPIRLQLRTVKEMSVTLLSWFAPEMAPPRVIAAEPELGMAG